MIENRLLHIKKERSDSEVFMDPDVDTKVVDRVLFGNSHL